MSTDTIETTEDPAAKTAAELFRFATWVHLGEGAGECPAVNEEAGTNACEDPRHFHAWVSLPNQFQHEEIRGKSLAAKARKARQLRDPESDACAILEDALDELARAGDEAKPAVIDEIVNKDWWQDWMAAEREIREESDEFEHIDRDRERIAEIEALDPDSQDADELAELRRHTEKYDELVSARMQALVKPRRESLESQDIGSLIDLIREDRITAESGAAFMTTYTRWSIYSGTRTSRIGPRVWPSVEDMNDAPPEVIEAIRDAVRSLEQSIPGNS